MTPFPIEIDFQSLTLESHQRIQVKLSLATERINKFLLNMLIDSSVADRKHFVTTSMNTYGSLAKNDPITNGGILADKTKWHHYLQGK